jgi:hypothetical protein
MKTTGYKLRQVLKELEIKRESLGRQFNNSFFAFPEDVGKKRKPLDIAAELSKVEDDIALFQTAVTEFNLKARVSVQGRLMPLAQAVKMIGGVARMIEHWNRADNFISSDSDRVRIKKKEDEVIQAEPQVSPDQILEVRQQVEKLAAAIRAAVAQGNSEEVEISLDLSIALRA